MQRKRAFGSVATFIRVIIATTNFTNLIAIQKPVHLICPRRSPVPWRRASEVTQSLSVIVPGWQVEVGAVADAQEVGNRLL